MNIEEAKSYLKIALIQVLPSDDKVIVDHMTQAYLALGGGLDDFLAERKFVEVGPSLQPQNTEGRIPSPPCHSGKHVMGTCACEEKPSDC